jgi:putative ABC transport system ATP-binding protein
VSPAASFLGREIVVLENVIKSYPELGEPILRNLSITVSRGEYVVVVGRSGSGKSTLLNIMGLLDSPTSGQVSMFGSIKSPLSESSRSRLRRQHIGFVFQDCCLLERRTSIENVALGILYKGETRRDRLKRADHFLEIVGLGHRKSSVPSALSGGEQQRVAIARAVVGGPTLLLCDEPTGNLDAGTSAGILDLFDELRLLGITTVVVTHDAAVAERADRVLRMDDGCLKDGAAGAQKKAIRQ